MFKILGIDDAVNACDCCGKTGLKSTVIVEVNGEIMHYGCVCATRHTGMDSKSIKHAAKAAEDARQAAAQKEYSSSPEYIALAAKLKEAHAKGIKPGREFRDYTLPEAEKATAVARKIAAAHGLEVYQVTA